MPDDPVAGAKAPATNSTVSHQNAWILQPPWRAVSALSGTVWKNSYQGTTFSAAVQTQQIKSSLPRHAQRSGACIVATYQFDEVTEGRGYRRPKLARA